MNWCELLVLLKYVRVILWSGWWSELQLEMVWGV